MNSETHDNVQIAANHLSLAELQEVIRKAEEAKAIAEPPTQKIKFHLPTAKVDANESSLQRSTQTYQSPIERFRETATPEEFVVVPVPSIGESARQSTEGRASTERSPRLQRVPQDTHPVPFVQKLQEMQAEQSQPQTPSFRDTASNPTDYQSFGEQQVSSEPRADLPERPEDWLPDRDTTERRSSKKAKPLDTPQQAFTELTDQVLDQFPLGPSAVVLVADADGGSGGETVAYQLANQLGEKNVGRVLLIDSHFEKRKLSERLLLGFEIGLADMLSTNKTFAETICETECNNLDFLPVGSDRMCKRKMQDTAWIAENLQSLKEEYQFIIVSAGNVFHRSTELWGKHCDASYMAVEMANTNQTVAKSGVIRLQQFGARLMGCVVTDVAAA